MDIYGTMDPLVMGYKSHIMREPDFLPMQKKKDADQLCSNTDSTIPLYPKISSIWHSSVTVQAGLCWTFTEITLLVFSLHSSFVTETTE